MKTPEQIAAETAEKIVPILVNDSYLSYREDAAKLILAALTEHAKGLEARILSDNKAYGCELRDPNGTIWEYAETLKKRVDELENELAKVQLVADHRAKALTELEEDRERLDWLETNRPTSIHHSPYPDMGGNQWSLRLTDSYKSRRQSTRTLRAAIDAARNQRSESPTR